MIKQPIKSTITSSITALVISGLFSTTAQAGDSAAVATELLSAQWLFFGFLIAMAVSNGLLFVTTKSVNFIIYSSYVLAMALLVASVAGLTQSWIGLPWFTDNAVALFANLVLLLILHFSRVILNLEQRTPKLFKVYVAVSSIVLINLLLKLVAPSLIGPDLLLYLSMIIVTGLVATGIYYWQMKDKLAPYYSLAWLVLLISLLVIAATRFELITGFDYSLVLMFGTLIETTILSFVLALKYKLQIEEARTAQHSALANETQAREAQEQIVELQKQAQEDLEYKVDERTFELRIALQELEEVNRQLAEKSTLDALTGIKNRAYFDKKLHAEFKRSRRQQSPLSVVMLDIDHFKSINDQYGHLIGDDCIRFVAISLKQHLKRPSDDACRYGGEEFALILPDTDARGAQQVAESIRAFIENHVIPTPTVDVKLTISSGVADIHSWNFEDEKQLLEQADKALYAAKQSGRNKVVIATEKTETEN